MSDDRAFSYLLLQYVFDIDASDQADLVTDDNNDGGIDFLYFDEDESKVIICQSKYTSSLSFEDIVKNLIRCIVHYKILELVIQVLIMIT